MQKIQNAFFCTTPFQIITAVVLNHCLGEESDLYVVPQFTSAAEYVENLRRIGLFNRVALVDTSTLEKHKQTRSKLLMHIGVVKQYSRVDKIAEAFLFRDTQYARMFVSSKAYIPRMAYLYYVKSGIDTELVYFDDGEGSYYNRYRIEASFMDNTIRRVMFGRKAVKTAHTLYLYNPELYKTLNGNHWNGTIIPIPHYVNQEPIKDWITRIFGITNEDLIKEKTIILDVLKEGKYSLDDIKKLFMIYGRVRDSFGYDETIVKRHPRDKSSELSSFQCYSRYNIPFECLCTQMNMNNKVLMTISSTAVILPKLLIGQEPVVILLYKLIRQTGQRDDYRNQQDHFYKLCKKNYSSSNRFYIPESLEELEEILHNVSMKSNEEA